MKKYGFLLMSVLMAAVPAVALAFNQGDLTRLLGGDNNMQNADLSGIGAGELTRRDLKSVDFTGADFRNCRLYGYQFDGSKLNAAKFDDASFKGSHFRLAKFNGASLRNADLSNAPCGGADFSNADLSGAKMAGSPLQTCKFFQAKLKGADLSSAMFFRADLTGADLTNATLTNADFEGAKVAVSWKRYLQDQNVRNFDKIEWVQPQAVKPSPGMLKPGAGKIDKEPMAPQVPIKK